MRYNSLCELMIYTLKRGDIPSLSAWIKKSRSVERDFLAPQVGLEPTTLRLTAACSTDWAIEECCNRPVKRRYLCRRRPIFPGGCPPSIVSTSELNYRVRDGNGWTLIVIDTDFIFNALSHAKSIYILPRLRVSLLGDPYGIRTHVAGVRGRSLRPLDQRAVWYTFRDSNPGHPD